jgi:hypothetical protein
MKQGSLFCFVLFVTHIQISQTIWGVPVVVVLLVLLESPQ